ncbi:putative lipoprotein YerB precursor [bacterium BMS3Abin02]|nr:putative lipoprotein YerB precursor [bacterium BMS3Abin02]GBE23387.1 putative lipoprotein YerB precursor [bacterium BMS3Bbin01]HDH26086.1 DUF3048 domain-containing protein [Actinomycetota bacterium]
MRSLLITILALSLLAAACSGGEDATTSTAEPTTTTTSTTEPTTTTTTTEPTTTTTAPEIIAPLTGLPVEDPTLVDRRVLAVKIDNHPAARPESGLQQADAVIELPVEGITRFMALFNVGDSDYLGPIRSGRPTDPTLVKPLGGTFMISGAQPWVLDIIRARGVPMVIDPRPGMFRISSRSAPHNLYGDTTKLREVADARGYPNNPPPNLFTWGPLKPDGLAEKITLFWSPRTVWTWNGEHYTRTSDGKPHEWLAKDGTTGPITADTLIVLFARRYTAYPPSKGTPVPAMDTVGSGRALVFAGGEVEEGTWTRDSIEEIFHLKRPDGSTLTVPPGKPWISLFPDTLDVTW